jgi:hypothetical protein
VNQAAFIVQGFVGRHDKMLKPSPLFRQKRTEDFEAEKQEKGNGWMVVISS